MAKRLDLSESIDYRVAYLELLAKISSMEKDAERYRFLRGPNSDWELGRCDHENFTYPTEWDGEALDAAIDADIVKGLGVLGEC